MPINIPLSLDIEPDEHGVYDGRKIARQLIQMAFEATIPYAKGCPDCADRLLTAIAENSMAEIHKAGLPDGIYALGEDATKLARFHAHAEDTLQQTADLLMAGSPSDNSQALTEQQSGSFREIDWATDLIDDGDETPVSAPEERKQITRPIMYSVLRRHHV